MTSTEAVVSVARDDEIEPERRDLLARATWRRHGATIATSGAVLLAFFAHFRPWQGGLVEEWGLVLAWQQSGFGAYFDRGMLEVTMARPLHLLPVYSVLEVSRGSIVGLYAAAGLLAVAQLLLAQWALVPSRVPNGLRWALGLAIALHPWWIPGYALRFLPAQVAVTLTIFWLGAAARYLQHGQVRWLLGGSVALLIGALTYPAPMPAVAFGLATVFLCAPYSLRRMVTASAATIATIGVYGLWSLIISPRLGATYEAGIMSYYSDATPLQAVRAILKTMLLHSPGLLALLALCAGLVVALGFSQVLTPVRAWLALVLIGGTFGVALVYYPSMFHLSSPEHIPLSVGLALWFVACGLAPAIARSAGLSTLVLGVALIAAVVGAAVGNGTWGMYAAGQQSMLALAAESREQVRDGELLVAADASGYYGSLYLLLPPYLDIALQATEGPGPEAVLCTQTGVARQPTVAAPDCATLVGVEGARLIGSAETVYGDVDFYSVPAATG